MYCPKCGTQNIEGAKFCRSCGADIIAVLEELTGRLPAGEGATARSVRRTDKPGAHTRPTPAQAADEEHVDEREASDALMFDWRSQPLRHARRAPMMKPHMMWGMHRRRAPKVEDGIQSLFWGVGMLCVAIATGLFLPGGSVWWFWLLLPAFGFMGGGVSEIVRARLASRSAEVSSGQRQVEAGVQTALPGTQTANATTQIPTTVAPAVARPHDTAEIPSPPPSVTEGTTRHLDAKNGDSQREPGAWRRDH